MFLGGVHEHGLVTRTGSSVWKVIIWQGLVAVRRVYEIGSHWRCNWRFETIFFVSIRIKQMMVTNFCGGGHFLVNSVLGDWLNCLGLCLHHFDEWTGETTLQFRIVIVRIIIVQLVIVILVGVLWSETLLIILSEQVLPIADVNWVQVRHFTNVECTVGQVLLAKSWSSIFSIACYFQTALPHKHCSLVKNVVWLFGHVSFSGLFGRLEYKSELSESVSHQK